MPGYYLFNAGVSAMQAQSRSFQTISSNITNATTPGFKESDIRFQDLVAGEKKATHGENLLGVQTAPQNFIDGEGLINPTNRDLDGAIDGSGYFVTNTAADGSGDHELTDAGSFDRKIVETGGTEKTYLADPKGNFLLGYNADPQTGQITADTSGLNALEPIDVTPGETLMPAAPSTRMDIAGNLPSTASPGETHQFDFTVLDGTGASDFSSDQRVVNLGFEKTGAPNAWDLTISGTGGTVSSPGTQPIPVSFDATGRLSTIGGSQTTTQDFTIDWSGPAASNSISLDLADLTQFSGPAGIDEADIDGHTDGALRNAYFNDNGQVVGEFSNGLTRPIAQAALGDVTSPNRMARSGETHYRTTAESGDIQLYDFATTSRASFVPSALEQSTVDFGKQFTDLITTQRAYSSAATTVQTVDEMIRVAAQLKS